MQTKNNTFQKELTQLSNSIYDLLVENYQKDNLLEFITTDCYVVGEDENGLPTDIIFCGGCPSAGLSLEEKTGVIWATDFDAEEVNIELPNDLYKTLVLKYRGKDNE